MGVECPLVKSCNSFGVGGEHWPVDVWSLPKESFAVLGPQNVRDGRDCMTRVMWNDTELRPRLDTCGGFPPKFLSNAVAPPTPEAVGGAVLKKKNTKSSSSAATKKKASAIKKKKTVTK